MTRVGECAKAACPGGETAGTGERAGGSQAGTLQGWNPESWEDPDAVAGLLITATRDQFLSARCEADHSRPAVSVLRYIIHWTRMPATVHAVSLLQTGSHWLTTGFRHGCITMSGGAWRIVRVVLVIDLR